MEKLSNNDVTTLCPLDNDDPLNDIKWFLHVYWKHVKLFHTKHLLKPSKIKASVVVICNMLEQGVVKRGMTVRTLLSLLISDTFFCLETLFYYQSR